MTLAERACSFKNASTGGPGFVEGASLPYRSIRLFEKNFQIPEFRNLTRMRPQCSGRRFLRCQNQKLFNGSCAKPHQYGLTKIKGYSSVIREGDDWKIRMLTSNV